MSDSEIYRHWDAAPVEFDRMRVYTLDENQSYRKYFKPVGLWFDVDSDWKRWCEGETFELECIATPHVLTFKPSANILRLKSSFDLSLFTEKYCRVPRHERDRDSYAIDWPRVREEHDGIIIAPYQWECRMDLMWYYVWDCASGCVWNLDCVEEFTVEKVGAIA